MSDVSAPAAGHRRIPHRIETERLVLRCYEPADAQRLRQVIADNLEHLAPYMKWIRFEPQSLDDKLELILGFRSQYDAGTNHVMGIFDKATNEQIGGTGLHPSGTGESTKHILEIGYWLTDNSQGNGFITEAVKALSLVAFRRRGLGKLMIRTELTNESSARIPARLGFTREGVQRRCVYFADDEPLDATIFSLLRDEFEQMPWLAATETTVRAFDALSRPISLALR